MQKKAIKDIVIIGDNLSGMFSALYLNNSLNAENQRVNIHIVPVSEDVLEHDWLVSSPKAAILFNMIGSNEATFMEECQMSFGLGSRYEGWKTGKEGFWQVYGNVQSSSNLSISLIHHWLHDWKTGKTDMSFAQALSISTYLCEAGVGPKVAFAKSNVPYGYHFDPKLLFQFISKRIERLEIKKYHAFFEKSNKKSEDSIASITLENGVEVEGDLFIDCTGIEGLVNGSDNSDEKEDYSKYALVNQLEIHRKDYSQDDAYNANGGDILPHTTCIKANNEIHFKVPMIGKEIQANFSLSDSSKERNTSSSNRINYKNGHVVNPWSGNCIKVGKSAFDMVAFDGTELELLSFSLSSLLLFFPSQEIESYMKEAFNHRMNNLFRSSALWCILPHCLSEFKIDSSENMKVPEEIKNLALNLSDYWNEDYLHSLGYDLYDLLSMVTSFGFLPEHTSPSMENYLIENTYNRFEIFRNSGKDLQSRLKPQSEYFKQLHRIKDFKEKSF